MSQQVSASVPIKVARQNYYATMAIDAQNSLAQTWDDATQTITPDWSVAANASKRPVLTPNISCQIAFNIISIEWFRDGVSIGTAIGGANDTNAYDITTAGVLTIKQNLASASNQDPDTFTCKIKIRVNNVEYELERSISATILPASSTGYVVMISANRTALSSETGKDSATLTAQVFYKGELQIPSSAITYKWFKGGTELTETSSVLVVSRNDVDWEQLYRLEVRVNSILQGVGSIVISDQADNYCLQVNVSDDVTDTTPATISIQLRQRKTGAAQWTNLAVAANYVADLYDVADSDTNRISSGTLDSTGKASFTCSDAQMSAKGIEAGYINIVATW